MDKIVFITGASSGIGAGCARKFASQGASLILNARNVNKLSALKEELEKQYGAKIYLLPFDVRDRKAATSALESLPKEWQSIDILVNNAGLVIGTDKEQEGSLDEWDIVIDTNIKALLAMRRVSDMRRFLCDKSAASLLENRVMNRFTAFVWISDISEQYCFSELLYTACCIPLCLL